MNRFLFLLIVLNSISLQAAELKPTKEGIEIDAGSLGTFQLSYPQFIDKADAATHPAIEVKTMGNNATVRYEAGVECFVAVAANEIKLTFRNVPNSVKSWKMNSLIDIGFAAGGSWKIGDQSGLFPVDKPKVPQIASLNSTAFSLKNAQGQSLTITTPEYAFQQLTDNREWNWAIFNWQFFVPYQVDHTTATLHLESDLNANVQLVDPFGQSIAATFPGKVLSLAELKADVASEQAYLAAIQSPKFDRYGGLPDSQSALGLRKTGFFHIEQKQPKYWLVDPDGNAFFHLGVCGFTPSDDFTYVKGREGIYAWLPKSDGEFATAFRSQDGDQNFSFHVANMIRKYAQPYTHYAYAKRMIERVKKWGFNSVGAFSPSPSTANIEASFPYVAHLPTNQWEGIPRIPGAHEVWDPFDAAVAQKLAENFRQELPGRANDQLLIGWFIVNEPRYDELPRVIPSLNGNHACKRRFVDSLKKRYVDIASYNQAWQANAESFDSLIDVGLAVTTDVAKSDVRAFVGEFLETYFAQIERLFRQHDPNHLLLGSRLQPITIDDEQLCQIMGKHLDVISYNYYTYGVDTALLRRIHTWCGNKPIMLSEFFWASPRDSGLIGGREVSSQQQRGLAYRNYVEQAASLGFIVGIEWFTLVDQATTGRWFSNYNGESYNTGLISVADRPWKEMLNEMIKTNHEIYDVLLGKRPAFQWDDPRFDAKSGK